ncbi:MAG: DUF998 domain-containing protein [Thermoflexales bacterium]
MNRLIRAAVVAGTVGPLAFGLIVAGLSVAQYDFMRGLGWHPVAAPTFDWPSGLALGPYGPLMTLAFVVGGAGLALLALGVGQSLRAGSVGRVAAALLVFAGVAMAGLASPTDPTLTTRVATLPGRIHDLSYIALGLSLFPAILLFAVAFRRDPVWRPLSIWTWLTLALAAPAFALKGIAFYFFLAAVVIWVEVLAYRLRMLGR